MKMLSKSFKDHLLKHTDQEFVDILMPQLDGVDIINASLASNLRGMATPDKIYIDVEDIIKRDGNDKYDLGFVILHELAHYKRIKKNGKSWFLNYVLNTDEDTYVKESNFEERFADRWSRFVLGRLYGIYITIPYRNYDIVDRMNRHIHQVMLSKVKTEQDMTDQLKPYILYVRQ